MTPTSEPVAVADLMINCTKRTRRLVEDRMADQGVQLSMPRVKLLHALQDGGCAQAVLAGSFGLAPRTITELVDGLERQGLVERTIDPSDRRVKRVQLTDAGQRAHAQAWSVRTKTIEQIFGSIGPEQLQALAATLVRLDAELNQANPDPMNCDFDVN